MARADRTGKRKPREAFRTRVPDLGYYFIVTDTDETEKNYLYGLRDSLHNEFQGRIVIKVSKEKTNELVKACKGLAALESQYGKPWIVFDRDEVVKFDEIIEEAHNEGISTGWSNPCLEIWFDAYFGRMHSYNDSVTCCKKFAETFEQRTGQEYHKDIEQIYTVLNQFGDEARAIQIADNRLQGHIRNGVDTPSKMCPCTTLHKLVEEIKNKVET